MKSSENHPLSLEKTLNNVSIADDLPGEKVDLLLKVYKWIWGQEDCNYPQPENEGRYMSMKGLIAEFLGFSELKSAFEKYHAALKNGV
ncbi:MAG TPA: hypothetical protein VNK24_05195 [Elusimicrobiota bacterium]|nr:hypothetical protein [Elusimicrobiota bacterium]